MKKLLSLLGSITIIMGATSQVISCNKNSSNNNGGSGILAIHKTLNENAVAETQAVAESLIMKNDDNYGIQSTLDVKTNNNLNFEGQMKYIFGHYSSDVQDMIDKNSEIKYQANDDKTETIDNSIIPNLNINGKEISANEIIAMLKTFLSSNDVNGWINNILSTQIFSLIQSLGDALSGILGQNNVLISLVNAILANPQFLLQSFGNVLTNFGTTFGNKKYADFDNKGNLKDSAFQIANDNLNTTIDKIALKEVLNENDFENIFNYLLLLTSYISKFNYINLNYSIDNAQNLFDNNIKNANYLENVNNQIISDSTSITDFINFDNIANLTNNLTNYKDNNGGGFAQIFYVLLGDSNNLTTKNNKTDIINLKVIPTDGGKNPFVCTLGNVLNSTLYAFLASSPDSRWNSAVGKETINNINLGGQLSQAIASLFSNIIENKKIDTPLNYLSEMTAIGNYANSLIGAIIPKKTFDDINKMIDDIKTDINFTSLDDTFVPSDVYGVNTDFNVTYPILNENQENGQSIFNQLWIGQLNSNIPIVDDINNIVNDLSGSFNFNLGIFNFNGLEYYVDEAMNTTVLNVTLKSILKTISSFLVNFKVIINELPKIFQTIENLLQDMSQSVTGKFADNAKTVYEDLVTSEGQKDPKLAFINQQTVPNALTYVSGIEVANANNWIKPQYQKNIGNIILNILRGEDENAPNTQIAKGSLIDLVQVYYDDLEQFLNSEVIQDFFKLEQADFVSALSQFTMLSESKTENNSSDFIPYQYTYKLKYIDPKTNKEQDYLVTLNENLNNKDDVNSIYYRMMIKNIKG